MKSDERLFAPDLLRRLRALFLELNRRRKLTHRVPERCRSVGLTHEFKDYRAYSLGDDYRSIDWRLYARLERLFIRVFEELPEYHITILLDTSASMVTPYGSKRVGALELTVALAYLGLMNRHRVSLLSFSDEVRRELPPLCGQGHIHTLLRRLGEIDFGGATDLERSLSRFRPSRGGRGLVFVLSDLLAGEPALAERALERSLGWPAETHVIHILDPRELEPELDGELQLVDSETGEELRLTLTRRELLLYREALREHRQRLARACRRRKVDYVPWSTGRPFEEMFLSLLTRGGPIAHG